MPTGPVGSRLTARTHVEAVGTLADRGLKVCWLDEFEMTGLSGPMRCMSPTEQSSSAPTPALKASEPYEYVQTLQRPDRLDRVTSRAASPARRELENGDPAEPNAMSQPQPESESRSRVEIAIHPDHPPTTHARATSCRCSPDCLGGRGAEDRRSPRMTRRRCPSDGVVPRRVMVSARRDRSRHWVATAVNAVVADLVSIVDGEHPTHGEPVRRPKQPLSRSVEFQPPIRPATNVVSARSAVHCSTR
jgi:hypothetical protein